MGGISIASADDRPIPGTAVRRLYDLENWWPERSTADIEAVVNALPAVGAWRADRLIGFARAVTDGRFRAYVEDVMVDPAERGQGIGRALLDHLGELVEPVPLVTLFSASAHVDWYRAAGFRSTNQVVLHRYVSEPRVRSE